MQASDTYEPLQGVEGFVGAGRFGTVKKVRRKRDSKLRHSENPELPPAQCSKLLQILACKSIRYQDSETSKAVAERECAILSQLDHPNVIKQFDVVWQPHKAKIYMEYCEGKSLQHLINERRESKAQIAEPYVWKVFSQLTSALLYCHLGLKLDKYGRVSSDQINILNWNPVLHRDIKPANVFLLNRSEDDFDIVKLGDFGLGYVLQNDAAPETYAGTAQYLAPEVNRMSNRAIHWTEHCDIFSLGCTIYALCTFEPPFDYHMETESDSYLQMNSGYSAQLRNVINLCLSFSPQKRPNALRLFQHCQPHVAPASVVANPVQPEIAIVEAQDNTASPTNNHTIAIGKTKTKRRKKKRRNNNSTHSVADVSASTGGLNGGYKDNAGLTAAHDDSRLPPTTKDKAGTSIKESAHEVPLPAVKERFVGLTWEDIAPKNSDLSTANSDLQRSPAAPIAKGNYREGMAETLVQPGSAANGASTAAYYRAAKHHNEASGMKTVATPARFSSNGALANTPVAESVEQDYLNDFKNFAESEKLKVEERRKQIIHDRNKARGTDLKKFHQNFRLATPIPNDLVPILAKDKEKQEYIVKKALRTLQVTSLPQPQSVSEDSISQKPTSEPTQRPNYHSRLRKADKAILRDESEVHRELPPTVPVERPYIRAGIPPKPALTWADMARLPRSST